MNKLAKIILAYTAITLIVIAGFAIYAYFTSYQYLIIQVPEDKQPYVSLYKADGGGGSYTKRSDEKAEIDFNTDMKLDRGLYIAEYSEEGFEPSSREINLDDEMVNISFNYKISKPARELILEDNTDQIHVAMEQSYPGILNRYTINEEGIYEDGSWYGAILHNKDQSSLQRDTIRIVMKNEAGSWVVAAKPYITISQAEYPEIPRSVLDNVNKVPGMQPGAN